MFNWLEKILWKRAFKKLRARTEALDFTLERFNPIGFPKYQAQIGPAVARLSTTMGKVSNMPEPQRTKFILSLIGQMHDFSMAYEKLTHLNIEPHVPDYSLRHLLSDLVHIYNDETGSHYRASQFLDLPTSKGAVNLFSFYKSLFKKGEEDKYKQQYEALGVANFELLRRFLLFEYSLLEMKVCTPYFKPLQKMYDLIRPGDRIDFLPTLEQHADIGVLTIDAVENMIHTAYDRSV